MLFQAAKYCNAKPWEMVEQSIWWTDKALNYLSAEGEAQEILKNRK